MICFHIASNAVRSVFMIAFCLGALLIEFAMLPARALGVRPTSDPAIDLRSSKPPLVGDNRAEGENSKPLSLEEGNGATGSTMKKVVTNVYSAVALSISTRRRDRKSASTGSFCHITICIQSSRVSLQRVKY